MIVKMVTKGLTRCVKYFEEISKVVHSSSQRLHKEILVWNMLKHENILPLFGITFDFGRNNPMGMVCPWLQNGNLNGHLERCGAALEKWDRFKIVSCRKDSSSTEQLTRYHPCLYESSAK